jgi:hypothetical protein
MFFEYELACETNNDEPEPEPDGLTENETGLNIHPNPVNDRLYIETENDIENITIFDIFGRQQQLSNSSHQHSVIDVSNLTSGIYFIKINTNNGEIVKRFVKK